jgi:hypothetical protein
MMDEKGPTMKSGEDFAKELVSVLDDIGFDQHENVSEMASRIRERDLFLYKHALTKAAEIMVPYSSAGAYRLNNYRDSLKEIP